MRFCRLLLFSLIWMGSSAQADALNDGLQAYKWGDYQKAYNLLLPLAERGEAAAQYKIGVMLVDGSGISVNTEQGVVWLGRAAENFSGAAANMLGSMYMSGFGVPLDHKKAAYYLEIAERLKDSEDEDCGCADEN